MEKNIRLYKENYICLPKRFANKIEQDISYILSSNVPGLKGIYLFGSCARGDMRNGSDVDLLILTEHKLEDRAMAADIRWTLDEPLNGIKTDVTFMNISSVNEQTLFNKAVNLDKKILLEVI